ncbi:MAG: pyridoxal-phosphate dependent enzyme [Fidelibacterota bacterium]|nr:MAG: pyridoxal-phosphate dependent enzyme [Candidatus Neomarinimicrobiota bacterium]
MSTPINLDHIRDAAERITPYAHRTPVLTCAGLDEMTNGHLFFKCENFQKVGAFKFRGACNAVFSLSDAQAAKGVATHSSGNHAAALALAARLRGISAFIVMPKTAPPVKIAAVKEYDGQITFSEATKESRDETLKAVVDKTAALYIPSYDDPRIIAGQGTAALELVEDIPDLDMVIAPVGGGGLLSGTALAVKGLSPGTQVIGAEPEGADDAWRSFQAGHLVTIDHPRTIADGLLMPLSQRTFEILRESIKGIVLVNEKAIIRAMRLVWERMKIIIEPSSAVAIAPLLEGDLDTRGLRVGVILSGGNVDLENLPWNTT